MKTLFQVALRGGQTIRAEHLELATVDSGDGRVLVARDARQSKVVNVDAIAGICVVDIDDEQPEPVIGFEGSDVA